MDIAAVIRAALLGILQGLTEFLPISSSAHLLIVPWLLGGESNGLSFDVVIHTGTLLAVVIYFRKELQEVAAELLQPFRGSSEASNRPALLAPLVLGSLPALLSGLFFSGLIEEHLRTPLVTALTLAGFGLLLGGADWTHQETHPWKSLSIRDGILIGLAQCFALVPGVSRSGVTITAALLLGWTRPDAARFSFLLGIPLIAVASVARLADLIWQGDPNRPAAATLAAGVLFSFLSGFLCIKYFLRFLQHRSFLPFVVYRLLLAFLIFWFWWR